MSLRSVRLATTSLAPASTIRSSKRLSQPRPRSFASSDSPPASKNPVAPTDGQCPTGNI
eukprot:CAMPEP_0184687772 /NCGR_PEP_ID=MMETSP0312-20130426/27522_1 /TAXON_ID=31354 /ORGANISM="Compsopogon coeruleus, Strain SAG 36.94" /LENGTH=58 /DNA_ID=CAMNT_0027144255 /DNA_START=100 /DNA_END=273 /DNA_ORIENTATION=+